MVDGVLVFFLDPEDTQEVAILGFNCVFLGRIIHTSRIIRETKIFPLWGSGSGGNLVVPPSKMGSIDQWQYYPYYDTRLDSLPHNQLINKFQ